ncbi:hypothetical protein Pcinc_010769 [Petrolisthes cinctipes]|uniref:Regulatory protein zeste n=1 Tax=Petrolisthes cinctipes TaxID=88211 RepID=A0AAE1G4K9_PETCI|nr:hypothetical protein Pcinc_010769 [Petrolisthes cinctipes]
MATAAEPPAKRSRRANFSDEEMMAMILGWQDRQDVLRERFSQNITAERKKQAWEDVTTEVNSVSRVLRGREEVKKKFADFNTRDTEFTSVVTSSHACFFLSAVIFWLNLSRSTSCLSCHPRIIAIISSSEKLARRLLLAGGSAAVAIFKT